MATDYEKPIRERRTFLAQSFGGAGATKTFTCRGPSGKRGVVRDIEVETTTAMAGTTAVPEIDVGTASGDASYARFRLGTAVGTGYAAGVRRARSLVVGNLSPPTLLDFAGHVQLETAYLPADTDFAITLKEGSGGTPAGVGNVYVDIEWF